MKRIRILALIMALSMSSLTACGSKEPVDNVSESNVTDEAASNQDDGKDSEEATDEASIEEEKSEAKNEATQSAAVSVEDIKAQVLASIVGEWEGSFMNGNRPATARVLVKPDGEYYIKLLFGADGWIHSYYSGSVEIEELGEDYIAVFKVADSDDGNFSNADSIGDFYIDAVRKNDYGTRVLYVTQANNGDSIFSLYFDDVRPMFYEYTDPYEGEYAASYYEVKSPSDDYYYKGTEESKKSYSLKMESIKPNEIIDTEEWFNTVGESEPGYYWADENYLYCKSEAKDYEYTQLDVYDNRVDGGDAPLLYSFNMIDFHETGEFKNDDDIFASYTAQGIRYALIKDDILYICTGHRTYAASNPKTGYITAIDINTGEVIWKTKQQVCNSSNFAIVDDTIVCGYGFTDEPDFLYVVDIKTGQVVDTYDVKNAVDYVVNQDNKLYVRCYSYNYVYDIER